MASDRLLHLGGELAELAPETDEKLKAALPGFAARGNPVDVAGDADAERYATAAQALMDDPNCDGVLAILTPQAMSDPTGTAQALVEVARSHQLKPLLTSFMGEIKVADGAAASCASAHVPTFDTPEDAVGAYMYMYQYTRNLANLYETPADILPDFEPDRDAVKKIFIDVARDGRSHPQRARGQGRARGLPDPASSRRWSPRRAEECADGGRGDRLPRGHQDPQPRHHAQERRRRHRPQRALRARGGQPVRQDHRARADGDARGRASSASPSQAMSRGGYEVIIGSKKDPTFGPALMFGMGGTGVELYRDVAVDFPPLNQALARVHDPEHQGQPAARGLPRQGAGRHGRARAGAGEDELPARRLPRDPRDGRQPAAGAHRRRLRPRRAHRHRAQGRAQDRPARRRTS